MILSGDRRDKVRKVTREKTRLALGNQVNEVLGPTIRVAVHVLSSITKKKYQSVYGDISHRIVFHGKPNIVFGETEYQWDSQWGSKRLKIISPAISPGPSNTWHTEVFANEVTRRLREPSEGS